MKCLAGILLSLVMKLIWLSGNNLSAGILDHRIWNNAKIIPIMNVQNINWISSTALKSKSGEKLFLKQNGPISNVNVNGNRARGYILLAILAQALKGLSFFSLP